MPCLYTLWRCALVLTICNATFVVDVTVPPILFENSFWLIKDLLYYLHVHLNSKKQNWLFLLYLFEFSVFKKPRQFHGIYSSVDACWLLPVYIYINSILAILFLTLWYHTALLAAHTLCKLNIHKYYWQTLSSIIITIMLVCPRCGTSNLHNRRSLSIHLARYCTGPTGKSTSRSHDGRHPLSMATTSHQQARHFNAPEVP
jgi:hypothetical protein